MGEREKHGAMGKVVVAKVGWTGPSFRWLFPRSVRRLAWSRGSLRRALQHKVGAQHMVWPGARDKR